jgi:hypothetical protein
MRVTLLVHGGEQSGAVGLDDGPDPVHHLSAVHARKIE